VRWNLSPRCADERQVVRGADAKLTTHREDLTTLKATGGSGDVDIAPDG
jgi:hypothetical protein